MVVAETVAIAVVPVAVGLACEATDVAAVSRCNPARRIWRTGGAWPAAGRLGPPMWPLACGAGGARDDTTRGTVLVKAYIRRRAGAGVWNDDSPSRPRLRRLFPPTYNRATDRPVVVPIWIAPVVLARCCSAGPRPTCGVPGGRLVRASAARVTSMSRRSV